MANTVFSEDVETANEAVDIINAHAGIMRTKVAQAIAAQREKSARIAETFIRDHGEVAKKIAALIRKNQFNN